MPKPHHLFCPICDEVLEDCRCAWETCQACGEDRDECECGESELFDADELGLDPDEDDMRRYRAPELLELLEHRLRHFNASLEIDPNA